MSNILLVDGSPIMRNTIGERLRADGHVVRDACDAWEAHELLNESAVDLIVLEPSLARGDGIRLLEAIRKNSLLKILPVIIYTTSDDEALLNNVSRLKAIRIIHKDVGSFEDIRQAIDEVAELSVSDSTTYHHDEFANGDGDEQAQSKT